MAYTPPWMEVAKSLIGTKEAPGSRNNDFIVSWAQVVGGWTSSYYTRDSIPWCGLFVAYCMAQVGITPTPEALRAKAWREWGKRLKTPCFGCVIVFSRKGGGHVGFYVSEDKNYYHVLGGNQSDMVNVTKIAKSRYYGAVWPEGKQFDKFYKPGRIYKSFSGKVSTNEA